MKKFIFLSLLAGLFAGDCLTTEVLAYQDDSVSGLRYRGRKMTPEEQRPFLTRNVTIAQEIPVKQKEEEINEDEVLSSLGQTWEDFKNKNFGACFSQINSLQSNKDPRALYLMGVTYENGYYGFSAKMTDTNVVEYYTLSMAYAEKDSPLYLLALKKLQGCHERRLKKTKDPRFARSRCR